MGWLVNNAREWVKDKQQFNKKNTNMAVTALKKEKKVRELLPADNYMARCHKIVHIGTTEFEKNGNKYELNKAVLFFEIIGAEVPFVIDHEIVLNTAKDTPFRKMLNTWRGVDLTDEEAEAFEVTALLGVPCMVNVGHKSISYQGGAFDVEVVLSVNKMPRTIICPAGKLPTVVLDYDNWSDAVYNDLPERIKKKIVDSVEYRAKFG